MIGHIYRLVLFAILGLVACAAPADPDGHAHHDSGHGDSDHGDSDHPHGAEPLRFPSEAVDEDPDPARVRFRLRAAAHTWELGGQTVSGYAYNAEVPGPTLRARVGDRVRVEITNDLDMPTSVHWHGLSVPNAVDGDAWAAPAIEPGATFIAEFVPTRAGTFWYHPHFDTERQVDLGLYGAFVVTDDADPSFEHDVVVVADQWGEAGEHGEGGGHGAHGAWALNGVFAPAWQIPGGDRVRMRWINVSNAGYLDLALDNGAILGGDQGLRSQPGQREVVGPGDRLEIALVGGARPTVPWLYPYSVHGGPAHGEPQPALTLAPGPEPAADLPDLGPRLPPSPDPRRTDLRYVLQGDDVGGWFINGEQWPDVTVPTVPLGAEVILEVRNLSAGEHPFHLHGHHFEVLSVDGVPPPERRVEDTLNVAIRQTVRLRWIADNPGAWMVHCHVLPHAHQGMMTAIRVE